MYALKHRKKVISTKKAINFFQKKDFQTATKKDVDKGGSTENPQSIIIRDGILDYEQLDILGLGRGWLNETLRANGATIKGVFLMTADKNGKSTVIPRQEGL